jgi:hypothetical protein
MPGMNADIELMNTIDAPSASTGSAVAAINPCARTLTAKSRSQSSGAVPARPNGLRMPTLNTIPSKPVSSSALSATSCSHAAGSPTSATSTCAWPPSPLMASTVALALSSTKSAHATAAPSRAASMAIARPLPTASSMPSTLRVPAPTTRIRLPASRSRPGALPVDSADGVDIRPPV